MIFLETVKAFMLAFRPTENGMVRIDGKIIAPPPADPTMDN